MKDFGEFNITHEVKDFTGPKVSIMSILNTNIIVEKYKIGPSKIAGKGDRLDLQIRLNGEQKVTWASSKNLISMIEKVPEFPFTARIVSIEGGGFKFIPAQNVNNN